MFDRSTPKKGNVTDSVRLARSSEADAPSVRRRESAANHPAAAASLVLLCAGLVACKGDHSSSSSDGTAGTMENTSNQAGPSTGAAVGGGSGTEGGTPSTGGDGTTTGTDQTTTQAATSSGGAASGGTSSGGTGGDGGADPTTGGASGTTDASSGGASSGGQSAEGGTGGSGGFTDCDPLNCPDPFVCCNDRCTFLLNDPYNCGECGEECPSDAPFCLVGNCQAPTCDATDCGDDLCCFNECCGEGELCCTVDDGASFQGCVEAVEGTCPRGVPGGVCASPDTPIATPGGPVPISALRAGDRVYSVDRGRVVVVPISLSKRTPVVNHGVLRITFDNGQILEISPGHPTADGRRLGDLAPGEQLTGGNITSVVEVPYHHSHTYDILPASDSGTYFAAGVLVASTLQPGDALQINSVLIPE